MHKRLSRQEALQPGLRRYNGGMESRGDIPYAAGAQQTDALGSAYSPGHKMLMHANWLHETGERAIARGRRDRWVASVLSLPALLAAIGLFFAADAVWDDTPEMALLSNWLLVGVSVALLGLAFLWALHRRGKQRQETGRRLLNRARRQQQFAREAG
jgi:hypothetical protein